MLRACLRPLLALFVLTIATLGRADGILLVPLDSRPAAGQFAQLIGRIASEDVRLPPYDTLGRFVNAGYPEQVLQWLTLQDIGKARTLIVSADMICYGGLIASRDAKTPLDLAQYRLKKLLEIRRRSLSTKLFVYSATTRLAPTATRAARTWRLKLARFEALKDLVVRLGRTDVKAEMESLRLSIPPGEIEAYEAARLRNHTIQRELVEAAANGLIDYLVIGQDDAQPYGPHVAETNRLRELVRKRHAENRVYFCEGIDQHASVLISRALLDRAQWTPKVRISYSDPAGGRQVANFESKSIDASLVDQIVASGGRPVYDGDDYDYTLYVNTPNRPESAFRPWMENLLADLKQGLPVAVADINIAKNGVADPELFDKLWEDARLVHLLAYAGWNTAGNTMGTAVPAANVYLLARKLDVNPLARETAQREFLLHRFVNDYAYHKYTRPQAYEMNGVNKEEVYGEDYAELNDFVQRDLQRHLDFYFERQLQGQRFYVGAEAYEVTGLKDVKVWLPWPRAYEVRLEFHLETRPASH